jgi:hypothetical protein
MRVFARIALMGLVLGILTVQLGVPALASPSALVLRETGVSECSPSQDIHTVVHADGDHGHKLNSSPIIVFTGSTLRYTFVHWDNIHIGTWKLYNESNNYYDSAGSYGFCGAG